MTSTPEPARAADVSVLVIEENGPLGSLMVTLLRQHGFAVDWLKSGADALERLDGGSFDAVVLDLMLPGRNGFPLLEKLGQRNGLLRRTVVTTGVSEMNAKRIRPLVFAVVQKPFDNRELVQTVARCAAQSKGGGAPGGGGPRIETRRKLPKRDEPSGPMPREASPPDQRRMTMLR